MLSIGSGGGGSGCPAAATAPGLRFGGTGSAVKLLLSVAGFCTGSFFTAGLAAPLVPIVCAVGSACSKPLLFGIIGGSVGHGGAYGTGRAKLQLLLPAGSIFTAG